MKHKNISKKVTAANDITSAIGAYRNYQKTKNPYVAQTVVNAFGRVWHCSNPCGTLQKNVDSEKLETFLQQYSFLEIQEILIQNRDKITAHTDLNNKPSMFYLELLNNEPNQVVLFFYKFLEFILDQISQNEVDNIKTLYPELVKQHEVTLAFYEDIKKTFPCHIKPSKIFRL